MANAPYGAGYQIAGQQLQPYQAAAAAAIDPTEQEEREVVQLLIDTLNETCALGVASVRSCQALRGKIIELNDAKEELIAHKTGLVEHKAGLLAHKAGLVEHKAGLEEKQALNSSTLSKIQQLKLARAALQKP